MTRISRDFRSREILAWRQYGPVFYRFRQLLFMAMTLVVTYALALVYLTLSSLYPGTGSVRPYGPTERAVQATVEECRRVGPVSDHGLGYWWICRVLVRQDDVQVQAVLDRSIAGPDDVGNVIALREACYGQGQIDCRYGEPLAAGWSFLYGVFKIIGRSLGVLLLFLSGLYLFKAIVGAPTYFSLLDRWRGSKGAT